MEIKGLTHPIPSEYANRIYEENKTAFVVKSHLGKVKEGDKFIIYESRGAKAYTGWGKIKSIVKMKPKDALNRYNDDLVVTAEELKEYAKGKNTITVIEFTNFEKFKKPVVPKRFVSMSGKYIYENEYELIKYQKDI